MHQLCLVKISSRHTHSAMSYERWCLLTFNSPLLSHTWKKTLSTTECSSGYRQHTEVGVVSAFSSCHQLCGKGVLKNCALLFMCSSIMGAGI